MAVNSFAGFDIITPEPDVRERMTTVTDVCRFLESLAPLRLAEPWDNVGLLLGRSERQVRSIMTCLTLTERVAVEALRRNVQMIVTHHPILFRAAKRITSDTSEGQLILDLVETGIAVYSPHTAFDSADSGINQSLAESLKLKAIKSLRVNDQEPGSGRCGILEPAVSRTEFLQRVCESVNADAVEYSWNGPEFVSRIAVACGSAMDFLNDAVAAACETFVTGEARFHAVLECQSRKINLILTGHYYSERPAVVQLATRLGSQFPTLEVFASTLDTDPLSRFSRSQ